MSKYTLKFGPLDLKAILKKELDLDFNEKCIGFLPSYRWNPNSLDYKLSKVKIEETVKETTYYIPGYSDRILFFESSKFIKIYSQSNAPFFHS